MIKYNPHVLQEFDTKASLGTSYMFTYTQEDYSSSDLTQYDEKLADLRINSTYTCIYEIPKLGKLKKPLLLHVEIDKYGFTIKSTDLDIVETGENAELALKAFFEYFIEDYNNWVSTPDKELSASAHQLKKKYLSYIR